jgi:hypothetical protein
MTSSKQSTSQPHQGCTPVPPSFYCSGIPGSSTCSNSQRSALSLLMAEYQGQQHEQQLWPASIVIEDKPVHHAAVRHEDCHSSTTTEAACAQPRGQALVPTNAVISSDSQYCLHSSAQPCVSCSGSSKFSAQISMPVQSAVVAIQSTQRASLHWGNATARGRPSDVSAAHSLKKRAEVTSAITARSNVRCANVNEAASLHTGSEIWRRRIE